MALTLKHQNFIDWMKAFGMFLIVYGHVVGDAFNPFNQISQPVYTKQLGVAFFVFITGWSLANDSRPRLRVVFNRLFSIYFYGLLFALLLSIIFIFTKNDTNPSNYLPFFLGINVFFNNFPANPTTWYIGTYLHLLVFWYFFMQGKVIGKKHLLLAFLFENVVRSLLMASGKEFIAYMLLPNWLTVFVLGMYLHQKRDKESTTSHVFLLIIVWIIALTLWNFAGKYIGFDKSFPFRDAATEFAMSLPFRSLLISIIYILNTLIFFEIARRLPKLRFISFLSRNTLIIFIVHVPIIFELSHVLYSFLDTEVQKKASLIFLMYFGLAALSEILQKRINIKLLRDKTWTIIDGIIRKIYAS